MFLSNIIRIAEVNGMSYWVSVHQSMDGSSPTHIQNLSSGDIVATGSEGALYQIDQSGVFNLMQRPGSNNSVIYCGTETSSGKLVLAGKNSNSPRLALFSDLNISGTLSAAPRTFTGLSIYNVFSNSNGDFTFLVKGSTTGSVIRATSAGVKVWSIDTPSLSDFVFSAFAVDASENLYVYAEYIDGSAYRPVVIKINSAGAIQWVKMITVSDGTSIALASANRQVIDVDSSGNVYVGFRYATNTRVSLIKLDSTGASTWQATVIAVSKSNDAPSVKVIDNNVYMSYVDSTTQTLCCFTDSGVFSYKRTFTFASPFAAGTGTEPLCLTGGAGGLVISLLSTQTVYNSSSQRFIVIFKLPLDGTLTGTYGSFSYNSVAASTTSATHTLSDLAVTFSNTRTTNNIAYSVLSNLKFVLPVS